MTDILRLFRMTDATLHIATQLAAWVPRLSITESLRGGERTCEEDEDVEERRWLAKEGYAILQNVEPDDGCAILTDAVLSLVRNGFPAVFLYAFDETWALGELVRARVSEMLGRPYELLEDAWAWCVRPGSKGWAPHRGTEHVLDRDAPELVTVWIALSDATAERACMHVVPLAADPGYPRELHRLDADLAGVRALPVKAGTALAWNANVLHWGGACSERARGPRVSCSFSLGRVDAREAHGMRPIGGLAALDAEARLDLIAAQIATYGGNETDIAVAIREWASATCALRAIGAAGRRT